MARIQIHVHHNDETGQYNMHFPDRCVLASGKCVDGAIAVSNMKDWMRVQQEYQTMQRLLEQVWTFGEL